MTLHVADIASYQQGLTLAQLRDAGFHAVNFKVSHGLGFKSVMPRLDIWVAEARTLGMGICTFHWLDNSAPGEAQAAHAFRQLRALGGPAGMGHVVDCEADAPVAVWRAYATAMAGYLGRPVATYTGDWWWKPRGWSGAPLTPLLWSAPNAGYLGEYPGDDSPHWHADYGGWANLAVMQYGVGTLPGGTVRVSKSAIRDPLVWPALTGGEKVWTLTPAMARLRTEFNLVAPNRKKDSDGSIGDQPHASGTSGHNPDETGNAEETDVDSVNEVRAIDVDKDLNRPGLTMEDCIQYLLRECRAGRENRIKYIIYRQRIWSDSGGWVQRDYGGANKHIEHAHISGRAVNDNDASSYGLASLIEGDEAMTPDEINAIASAVLTNGAFDFTRRRAMATVTGRSDILPAGETNVLHATLAGIVTALADLGADVSDAQAAIEEAVAGVDEEVVAKLGDASMSPEEIAVIIRQLPGVDGRESAVGQALIDLGQPVG